MTVVMAIVMWGILYQGYNAVFPAFCLELFPTRTRVSAFAISQNIGTALTGLIPTIYALMAPPGSGAAHVALVVGSITFAVTILCSLAALSARETYRVHMDDLGVPGAQPVPKDEYERIRAQLIATTSS